MNQSQPLSTELTEEKSEEENLSSKAIDNSMGEFYQLRNNIFIGTLVIALLIAGLTWWLNGQQTSLNYLLGTCFSLVYVNMLAREVEKVGREKKGAVSTRLLIFVGLIIVATKIEQLEVIPIFLGFMTYKAAILFCILPMNLLGNLNKANENN
jgi:ATP synthase protein I